MPGWEMLLQVLNTVVSLAILSILFALIFKYMPSTRVAWRDVRVGAFVTAVLFEIGKIGIGLYLGKSGMSESFQAAGAIVLLLAWVYYAAQIFLLGAEFTKVYASAHGSMAAAKALAATDTAAQQADAGTDASAGSAGSAEARPGGGVAAGMEDAQRLVEKRTRKAAAKLTQQLVGLVALSLASTVVSHMARRRRRRAKRLQRPAVGVGGPMRPR
jgi:membrane protein